MSAKLRVAAAMKVSAFNFHVSSVATLRSVLCASISCEESCLLMSRVGRVSQNVVKSL